MVAGVVGGGASVASGGKFESGATAAVFGHLFNDLKEQCASIERRICNGRAALDRQYKNLDIDPKELPEKGGPNARLEETRQGHRTLINIYDSRLRKAENEWDSAGCPGKPNCGGGNSKLSRPQWSSAPPDEIRSEDSTVKPTTNYWPLLLIPAIIIFGN